MMLMLLMLDTENVKAKKRGFFLLLTLGKTKPKSGAFIFAEVHRLSMQPAAKTRPNDLAEKSSTRSRTRSRTLAFDKMIVQKSRNDYCCCCCSRSRG